MSEWFQTLEGIHMHLWRRLSIGVTQRTAPARHPVLATVGPDGWPEARTVVLRGADPEAGLLEVHTDIHSAKVASLRGRSTAALHVWDEAEALQIRVRAEVSIHSGAEVAAIWAGVPDPSRQSYGITPSPGQPIANALDYVKEPDPATFAVLRCKVQKIDAVHLGERHRRALFARADGWTGEWLAP